jgi:hypothetical protein
MIPIKRVFSERDGTLGVVWGEKKLLSDTRDSNVTEFSLPSVPINRLNQLMIFIGLKSIGNESDILHLLPVSLVLILPLEIVFVKLCDFWMIASKSPHYGHSCSLGISSGP